MARGRAAGEDARFTVYGALDYASVEGIWQTEPAKGAATGYRLGRLRSLARSHG